MDLVTDVILVLIAQLQTPTLAFLIGGMVLAALGSKLEVPEPVYKFIVLLLLLKIGLSAGIAMREADLMALLVPALAASATGILVVLLGAVTLCRMRGVSAADGMATTGLFGAVSASTLAAGMAMLDEGKIAYEGFVAALYPFMDIAALVTAIVLARLAKRPVAEASVTSGGALQVGGGMSPVGKGRHAGLVREILTDTFRSPAISALLLGLALGFVARPDAVYSSFYEPLFRGLLSLLMLVMGMEAYARLSELRKVAHAYVIYGLTAPLVHGALGFVVGLILHYTTGFSAGGAVVFAVMAASSSDVSGPPTMRGALPDANPSAYVGCSTGLGTPVAIFSIPLWIAIADAVIGF